MQAVILAGGLATRLGERARDQPKSLLVVGGRPFLAWQLEALARAGIADVVLCIAHLGESIRAFAGDGSAFGLRVRYAEDGPTPLGTGGALRAALDVLEPELVVTYGDSYLPFDYSALLVDLRAHPEASGTMSVYENRGRWDSSNVAVERDLVVRYEKGARDPALRYIDYGATALRRSVIGGLAAGEPLGLEQLLGTLVASLTLRAYVADTRFYEIGSEAGLAELDRHLRVRKGG